MAREGTGFLAGLVCTLFFLQGAAFAQENSGERRGPPAWVKNGEYKGPRPPENATPEERRAFWQARAAERAKAEAAAAAAAGDAAAVKPEPAASPAKAAESHAGHAGHMAMPSATPAGRPSASVVPAKVDGAGRPRGAAGDGVLWLSDLPPQRREGGGRGGRPGGAASMGGMSGMSGMGDMSGMGPPGSVPTRRLWLRAGNNPQTARSATSAEAALLLDAQGMPGVLEVEAHGGPYNVSFPMPEAGVYNVYFMQRAVEQETLNLTVAKAEVMRSAGHSKVEGEAQLMVPRTDARVPVEIVRERKDKEGLFTRINYGDLISFQVLRDGKPVQNARVTFTSGQGWSNSRQTDEEGRAAFVVVRDYFPEWGEFDRRHRETYLVSASFATEQAGEWQGSPYRGVRYTTTLAGAYYPSVNDYESYAWGLGVALVGVLFSGCAIYLYRRRRVKPYREVRFDE